jgi:hypothetical protein
VSDTTDHGAMLQAILSAPGMVHINRTHARTFSLNIFRRNAQELLAATRDVRDPEQGLQLMAVDNREAGQQAHREINRFVHNFVASAMTLVDHTRNFVREHYDGTALKRDYDDRVKANLASVPAVRFVQDLRNYMLHRTLPQSQMFIEFDSRPESSGGQPTLETGVRYQTSALLEWDGWTAPARAYIAAAGEHIDIHTFVESYLEKVLAFHEWLDAALNQFHADDLVKLMELQEAYAQRFGENTETLPASPRSGAAIEAPPSADPPPTERQFEFSNPIASLVKTTSYLATALSFSRLYGGSQSRMCRRSGKRGLKRRVVWFRLPD